MVPTVSVCSFYGIGTTHELLKNVKGNPAFTMPTIVSELFAEMVDNVMYIPSGKSIKMIRWVRI